MIDEFLKRQRGNYEGFAFYTQVERVVTSYFKLMPCSEAELYRVHQLLFACCSGMVRNRADDNHGAIISVLSTISADDFMQDKIDEAIKYAALPTDARNFIRGALFMARHLIVRLHEVRLPKAVGRRRPFRRRDIGKFACARLEPSRDAAVSFPQLYFAYCVWAERHRIAEIPGDVFKHGMRRLAAEADIELLETEGETCCRHLRLTREE